MLPSPPTPTRPAGGPPSGTSVPSDKPLRRCSGTRRRHTGEGRRMRPAVVHLIGGGAVLRVEPQAAVVGCEERVVGGLVAQARIGIMGDNPLAGSSKFETDAGRPFDFQAAIRQFADSRPFFMRRIWADIWKFANSRPIFRLPFPAIPPLSKSAANRSFRRPSRMKCTTKSPPSNFRVALPSGRRSSMTGTWPRNWRRTASSTSSSRWSDCSTQRRNRFREGVPSIAVAVFARAGSSIPFQMGSHVWTLAGV